MALSNVVYELTSSNMGTNSFSYSAFRTLGAGADPEADQFGVFWQDAELVKDTDYTVNTTLNTVSFLSPVTNDWVEGEYIAIKRNTKKDFRYVDWTDNAGITEQDLDLDGDQLLFIAQEAWDETQNALRKNPTRTFWAGQSLPSTNCAPAMTGSGWVTLDQVNNLINGGDTGNLSGVNVWCFTGDGSTTDFVLNGASPNTSKENLMVTVNGLTICFCDDPVIFEHHTAAQAYVVLSESSITSVNMVGSLKAAWISALNDLVDDTDAALDTDANVLSEKDRLTMTVRYIVRVDAVGGTPQDPPLEFVGTQAECLAYLNTFTGATYSGWLRVYDIQDVNLKYTWDQETRTLSFTNPPWRDTDICIRQLTGTVAVDLADVSLDGSELQDDSITLRHLDFDTGSAIRLLKIDASGNPSAGTITSGWITDFAAAVQSLEWRTLAVPTSAVSMNTQKITNLQAGSSGNDAVNYGQHSGVATRVTSLETQVAAGAAGHNSTSGTPTIGVQPDLYYNNSTNIRNGLDGGVATTACTAQLGFGDENVLMRGFIPRWIKFMIHGDIVNNTTNSRVEEGVHLEFEFINWDTENNFNPVYITEEAGTRRVYRLNRPRNLNNNYGNFDYPGSLDHDSFELCIEQVSPWRTWLRIVDSGQFCRVTKQDDSALPGSIQVIASKGL